MWSVESAVWSVERGVWGAECAVWRVERAVWGMVLHCVAGSRARSEYRPQAASCVFDRRRSH